MRTTTNVSMRPLVARPRSVKPLPTPDAFALNRIGRSRMMGHEFPSLRAAWVRS